MTTGKKRPAKEVAAELDEIGGALAGAYGRRVLRIAAELRGETVEPTENEKRDKARSNEGDSDT